MSCSLGTYPSTRQVAPTAPVGALRAAAERMQNIAGNGISFDMRRPNYLLDVPVSAIDVDRWERRMQEARGPPSSSSSAAATGQAAVSGYFQTASLVSAARSPNVNNGSITNSQEAAPATIRHLAPFPRFVFASVKTLPMTQLLKLRRQWLPHRQRFPVHQQRMGFLDAVLNHAVVALIGPTGSGRTLQVPIVLSETEVLKRRRLVVVSANATAARLTVLRLREERGEDVHASRTVAAALPNFVEINESTSVVVTTAEVLLRQLLCDPCLDDVGCVVLDDAHLRSESTELCLALLRDLLAMQQQQQHQLQMTATSTFDAAATGVDSAHSSADATRGRRLHLVLNCPDEASATTLLSFLTPSRCKTIIFTLQAPSVLVTSSTTLYLEETVQWLLKCEKEGSCLVRGGGADSGAGGTVESALLAYAENVDAVARIMAAGDADFTQPTGFRQYWLPLICECVDQYDKADRQARSSRNPGSPLPAILIVAPNNYYVHVITSAVREAHQQHQQEQQQLAEGENASISQRVFTALADDLLFENFVTAAQGTAVTDARQRWVIVATSELSQTVLPSNVDVGLVVDCARSTYTAVDAATMADTCTTEYSSIAQLRYRRRLAKVMMATEGADASNSSRGGISLAPVVIQLIPKSVLHSAQHRRLNADPAQHIVFRLPFHRYVQLYQALQAREEALLAQRAAVAASLGGNPHHGSNESGPTVAAKISSLLSGLLIGVPPATANKYETVRRVMASVESYLRAAAHLAVDNEVGSISSGRLALQPMGVLSLCLPVPFPVARLLVAGSLLRPSVSALTAIGALWCCSDLLSLQGIGAVRAAEAAEATRESVAEQAALLGEARLFFSRDSLSDVVAAFHVYQMWCTVRGDPAAERDFLEECGVTLDVLTSVFETQVGLCAIMHSFGLLEAPPRSLHDDSGICSSVGRAESAEEKALRASIAGFNSTAQSTEQLRAALGTAMSALAQEVSSSRVLHACVTAALYPSCIVPIGEEGTGLLYDAMFTVAATAGSGSDATGPVSGGRRVASFAEDSLLADARQSAKAAGKPFVFLSKGVADNMSREAAGASFATATATVVEQLNPLHEAAALVFCGHTYERPRKAPLRCRGWSSLLTMSWRETRRARGLPPIAQLPPTSIVVQSYDTVHCQQVVCTMDQSFSLTMRATTSRWLQQLRTHVRGQLTALVRGVPLKKAEAEALTYPAVAAELAEAWAWWERRHAQSKEWLHEERLVVANQQGSKEKDETDTGKEGSASAAAKAAALRQRLYGYYEWRLQPGAPAAVVVPSSADRRAAAKTAAAAAAADATALMENKAADEDNEEGVNTEGVLPATYGGKLPPADVDHIFRQCAKSMAAKGTREAEARLLRDSPDMFSFLNPEDPYHEYYLYLLRQAAPDMEVLGDNLEELINFLEGVEAELREELGYTDPAADTGADASGAAGDANTISSGGGGGGGVLGDDAQGTRNNGGAGNANNNNNMWGSSGVYEVHDVVDGEGGYGEGDDLYADDGGGLQLESAAVNLKKNAGPTLAEQIEQTRRAQATPSNAKTDIVYNNSNSGVMGGVGGSATTAAGNTSAVFPSVTASTSMAGGMGNGAASAAAMPFVSTNSGETLADKLKAMQMAAMQGSSATGSVLSTNITAASSSHIGGSNAVEPNGSHGDAQLDYVMPQPTAEDLLAAINFGGANNAMDFATPPPQRNNNDSGGSIGSDLFQAPTTEELMALLGNTVPLPPSATSGGVLDSLHFGGSALGMMPTPPPPQFTNPLSRPPPAIPAKALEERAPSVLVYPVPNCRRHGSNVRLLLAKSLGEALNMRVGPTVIVGRVARVDVPNRNVEARALALQKFQCAEQIVYLLRNDRIIDDPARERREQRRRRAERDGDGADYHERCRHRGEEEGWGDKREEGEAFIAAVAAVGMSADLTSADASYVDPSAYDGRLPDPTVPAVRIGVLSSSEDEDDNSDSSSSSSSSSL